MGRRETFNPDHTRLAALPSGNMWRYSVALDSEGKNRLNRMARAEGISPDLMARRLVERGLGLQQKNARLSAREINLFNARLRAVEEILPHGPRSMLREFITKLDWRKGWYPIQNSDFDNCCLAVFPTRWREIEDCGLILRRPHTASKKARHEYALNLEGTREAPERRATVAPATPSRSRSEGTGVSEKGEVR